MSSRYTVFAKSMSMDDDRKHFDHGKTSKRHKPRRRRRKRHSNSPDFHQGLDNKTTLTSLHNQPNLQSVPQDGSARPGFPGANQMNVPQITEASWHPMSVQPMFVPRPPAPSFNQRIPMIDQRNTIPFAETMCELPRPGIAPFSMPNDCIVSDEEDAKHMAEFFEDVPEDILLEIMHAEEERAYLNSQVNYMQQPISMQGFDQTQRFENVPGAVYSYHVQGRDLDDADDTKQFSVEANASANSNHYTRRSQSARRDYSAIASRNRTHATRMDDDGVQRKVRGRVEVVNRDPDAWDSNRQVCSFFLRGVCLYGESCRDAHRFASDECPNCHERVGYDILDHQIHIEICPAANSLTVKFEQEASKNLQCGICHESPVARGKQFGLLTECNHPFCLDCIRKWRGVLMQSKEAVRGCPICRKASWFIVPYERMVSDPIRKKQVILDYKERLATIPCKHFSVNEDCPFGTSCFYKHVKKDGTVEVSKKLRHVVDANGNGKIIRDYTLRDHFMAAIGPSH